MTKISTECSQCSRIAEGGAQCLLRLDEVRLMVPLHPHIAPQEGGHLVVTPSSHVSSRRDLSARELLSMDILSLVGSDVLQSACQADWFNYQENGNWAVGEPKRQHVHLHVYGRRRDAIAQPFGEALRFPFRAELDKWTVSGFAESDLGRLRELAQAALEGDKVRLLCRDLKALDAHND